MYALLANPYIKNNTLEFKKVPFYPNAFKLEQENRLLSAKIDPQSKLKCYYFLNISSLLAPMALNVSSGHKVLDMCAAPGGKSLALIFTLINFELTVNELSRIRRKRLHQVLKDYLPNEIRQKIAVKGYDARRFGLYEKEVYDRILLDAPCSGGVEKSVKYIKRLASNQYALLTSALLALKPGGLIVYSTCTDNPKENDDVIRRLFERKGEQIKLLRPHLPLGEKSEFGQLIPSPSKDKRPFYLAVISKF